MLEFLLILFFSKTVLLTPDFVDINSTEKQFVLYLDDPISAINYGADIEIDITAMLPVRGNIIEIRKAVSEMFPVGSIEAILSTNTGDVGFGFKGNSAISSKTISITLEGKNIPLNTDFYSVKIKTSVDLENVKIYWKNHSK